MSSLRRIPAIALVTVATLAGAFVACGGTGDEEEASNSSAAGGKSGASGAAAGKSGAGASSAGQAGASSGGSGFTSMGGTGGAAGGSAGTAGSGQGGGQGGVSQGGAAGTAQAGKGGQGGVCQINNGGQAGTSTQQCGTKEVCGNGFDDDCNGFIDEGCDCALGQTQPCYAGNPAHIGKGICKAGVQKCEGSSEFPGWGNCTGAVYAATEVCEGKVDENCNGVVDDNCGCCEGATEACGSSVGACKPGKRTCLKTGVFGPCEGEVAPTAKDTCDDKIDNNCNGQVDEGCVIQVAINVSGDCVCSAPCPPQAPYPVGCNVTFSGGDNRGCVAIAKSQVYFQEGDACGAGKVTGQLFCSSQPGVGLNAQNCPINKSQKTYGQKPSDCVSASGTHDKCFF